MEYLFIPLLLFLFSTDSMNGKLVFHFCILLSFSFLFDYERFDFKRVEKCGCGITLACVFPAHAGFMEIAVFQEQTVNFYCCLPADTFIQSYQNSFFRFPH